MKTQRYYRAALVFVLLLGAMLGTPADAATQSRVQLKTYFETGDIPTEDLFVDLIDSLPDLRYHYAGAEILHTVASLQGGIAAGNSGSALLLREGEVFDPALQPLLGTAHLGLGTAWPGDQGFLAFTFEIVDNGNTTTHNGFVQMSVDAPNAPTPYAIHITGIAYETTPNTPITMFNIPEPGSLVLLGLGGLLVTRRRRAADRPESC